MKAFIQTLVIGIPLILTITFGINFTIDGIEAKLATATKTEIADKKLIRSLQRRIILHEKEQARYHAKRGTTVDDALCEEIKYFLTGKYSLFPL